MVGKRIDKIIHSGSKLINKAKERIVKEPPIKGNFTDEEYEKDVKEAIKESERYNKER